MVDFYKLEFSQWSHSKFQKVDTWGRPRLDGWDGLIEEQGCSTCKQPRRMPSEFTRIIPTPPSTGGHWSWLSAETYAYFSGEGSNSVLSIRFKDYLADLNTRPLNWNP